MEDSAPDPKPGRRRRKDRPTNGPHALSYGVGAPAGFDLKDLARLANTDQPVPPITCFDYSKERCEVTKVTDIAAFLQQHRPDWVKVRWINVDGLGNMGVIRAFAEKYTLHPLAIEDVLHVPQRPKVDTYPPPPTGGHGRIFIVARMLKMQAGRLEGEQISIFLGHDTVISFQERPDGDLFGPLRTRLKAEGSRVRDNDASFLMYSMIDAIVDHCFPLLENFSDRLDDLEDEVLARPSRDTIAQIHIIKRELLVLRRAAWPMREVIGTLSREDHECLSATTKTYLRDVSDHAVQILDMVETYREYASGLTETYMTAMSNRMNEIMKVLTIIGTIFIPLTFLAGVYGMNFHDMPELSLPWAYPLFWVICVVMATAMIAWFRHRKWL